MSRQSAPPRLAAAAQARALALLLGPVLVATWAACTLLAWALLPLGGLHALLVGACLMPTDPVLAHTIVKGGW
jgi:NhaP-type Na+/H+ or K+/H+ antiporter